MKIRQCPDASVSRVFILKLVKNRRKKIGFWFSSTNKLYSLKINKKSLNLHRFLIFTKKRLYDFKGTGKKYLLLRLKEIEYSVNNPIVVIFDRLGEIISKNF